MWSYCFLIQKGTTLKDRIPSQRSEFCPFRVVPILKKGHNSSESLLSSVVSLICAYIFLRTSYASVSEQMKIVVKGGKRVNTWVEVQNFPNPEL